MLNIDIPKGYATNRPEPDYTTLRRFDCPYCQWSGYAPHDFKGRPVSPCPHEDGSSFEEWK